MALSPRPGVQGGVAGHDGLAELRRRTSAAGCQWRLLRMEHDDVVIALALANYFGVGAPKVRMEGMSGLVRPYTRKRWILVLKY